MLIRIECTVEGLAGNWVDLSGVWSRKEIRDWYTGSLAGDDDVTLPLLARKLTGVHMHLVDGTLVEDGESLIARIDELDMRLVRWLAAGVGDALQRMFALGERKRRLLFDGVEVAQPTIPQPTPR